MTERELRRLSRQDLLQLLLAQSKEVARQKDTIAELKNVLEQERELTSRLKAKLDEKDETIEHLKMRLDSKDETLNRLKEETAALHTRLDAKDLALDATRARMDRMELGSDYPSPRFAVTDDGLPKTDAATEERLRRLKALLAQSEAMADLLRKDKE